MTSVTRRYGPQGLQSRIRKITAKLKSASIKAGVLEAATYPNEPITDPKTGKSRPDPRAGMHVATIAAALEYGHGQNHPRPFMQQTVADHRNEWAKALVTLLMQGVPTTQALMTVGQVMKEDIRQTITDWPADNSEAWAAVKGFNKGLVWTSHLLNSIEAEVVQK